jgi:hypothetical protein
LDFDSFKELCYSLQGLSVIKVKEVKKHKYPNNYYEAIVSDDTGSFTICENCYVKYLCFRVEENEKYLYFDKPKIEKQIAILDTTINVLKSETLNTEVSEKCLGKLTKNEKKEVKKWLPETIGGVMFSWYFD